MDSGISFLIGYVRACAWWAAEQLALLACLIAFMWVVA